MTEGRSLSLPVFDNTYRYAIIFLQLMRSKAFKTPIQVQMNAQRNNITKLWWFSGYLSDQPVFLYWLVCPNLPADRLNVESKGSDTAYGDTSSVKDRELRGRNG